MLVDTGADATLLPSGAVEKLGIVAEEGTGFEVQVFDGDRKFLKTVRLELYVLDKKFSGEYLVMTEKLLFGFAETLVRDDSVIPALENTMRLEIDRCPLFAGNRVASFVLFSIQISTAA